MTISVAAHHRDLGTRLLVDEHEAVTWVQLLLGRDGGGQIYAAGELSTMFDAREGSPQRLTTRFYYLFLSEDGRAQAAPSSITLPLVPIS